jgi:hypothetical protein
MLFDTVFRLISRILDISETAKLLTNNLSILESVSTNKHYMNNFTVETDYNSCIYIIDYHCFGLHFLCSIHYNIYISLKYI